MCRDCFFSFVFVLFLDKFVILLQFLFVSWHVVGFWVKRLCFYVALMIVIIFEVIDLYIDLYFAKFYFTSIDENIVK